jgi:hypothetical protein
VVGEDVAEDEVAEQVVELHFCVSHDEYHACAVADHEEVQRGEETFEVGLYIVAEEEGECVDEQVEGGIEIDDEEDGAHGGEVVDVEVVE